MRLSTNSPAKKATSPSQQIQIASTTNLEKPVVSLVLSKKINTALEQFENAIGGRQELIDSLSLATLDKREAYFLGLLTDPKRRDDDINDIAREAGLKPLQIVELFRSSAFSKAHAIAMGKLSNTLPGVVQDIADKAVDTKVECPTCFGDGKGIDDGSCIQCGGRGAVMRFSDLDRQKIVLETVGLTKKSGGGVNVNVQQNVGIVQPGTFFSKFVKESDSTAYDVIDADPIEIKE